MSPADYTNSGYERGHLAPNYAIGSRYGRDAQVETFKMTNIAPQKAGLNRGFWKDVEELEAKKGGYADRFDTIWVICGCIWDADKTFIAGKIEIPDYFYKIIVQVVAGKPSVMGFVFPQVPPKKGLNSYLKSVDAIEALTHIDFMADLVDSLEDEIEAVQLGGLW